MKNNNYKISVAERITRLETQMEDLITNHFPHLKKKVDKLYTLLWTAVIGIIGILIAFVLNLVEAA